MKQWVRILVGMLCLAGVAGCSNVQGYLEIAKENGISEGYLQALDRWTRSEKVYSQFETKAHIEATLRSPDFNRAYLEEYGRIYQLNADERRKMEETQAANDSEYTELVFYAYIPDKAENDFDRRGSIWSIFLVDGKGEKIAPLEIRRIDPVTSVMTGFFPYINPYYGIAYWLRFSSSLGDTEGGGRMKLIFTSVVGKVEMEF
jgi:hypothetical protein